jgi:hypothetical protein
MKKFTGNLIIFLITLLCIQSNLSASEKEIEKNKKDDLPGKILIDPAQSLININNITSWVAQDGYHDWLVGGSWNGAFPIGNNVGTIFSEGIVWGGIVNDGVTPDVRVNGNTYSSGCSPVIRLYRVRSDYQTADLTMDAATFFNITPGEVTQNDIDQIYSQYQKDWNEWPAYAGAPYTDIYNDGYYDPGVDTPGVPSASQTIFIKYKDDLSSTLYESPPIGLEISETYWTFSTAPLKNTIFKKIDIVYTGGSQPVPGSFINDMYICQWSDPDVGDSRDDFAGCDTSLNLGYAYNASQVDSSYLSIGLQPPASGYIFLQGVSGYTGNSYDSAIFNFKWRKGYKYFNPKPMSSYVYFASGGVWRDPSFNYTGTLEFYNLMRGYLPEPPYPASFPFPAAVADYTETGCYLLTGDPVAGTGKLDGNIDTAGDRRILLSNGPFNINLGDTIEVVIALASAIGDSYLSSITELRKTAYSADSAYLGYITPGFILGTSNGIEERVSNFNLSQNYPNPFNPRTRIQYSIGKREFVSLKVYDLLGREVAVLINEEKSEGNFITEFDGIGLPSGIYFYRLKAGSFIDTKKFILLK